MIIGLDPHFECFAMRLADIGVAFTCNVTKPPFVASMYGYGHAVTWVFFSVFVSFRHVVQITMRKRVWPKNNTCKQILTKRVIKCLFCKKALAMEDKRSHIGSDVIPPNTGPMRNENKEWFTLTRAQWQALRVIARETKMPMAVQLIHAHMQWITKKDRNKK
jgi:hypothetical protein